MLRLPLLAALSLRERLIRRLTFLLVLVVVAISLLVIWRGFTVQGLRVETEHQTGIERATANLVDWLQPRVNDTLRTAKDPLLLELLRGVSVVVAATDAYDMVRLYPRDLLSVSLMTPDGRVAFEVSNVSGTPLVTPQARLAERPPAQPEAAFFAALTNEGAVEFGRFVLSRDPATHQVVTPPRVEVAFYRQVRDRLNNIVGIVRVNLNALPMLNIVNNAKLNFIGTLEQRSVILASGHSLVLADSSAPDQLYLTQLEAAVGNLAASPLYQRLGPVLGDPAGANRLLERFDELLVSARQVTLADARGADLTVIVLDDLASIYSPAIVSTIITAVAAVLLGLVGIVLLRRIVDGALQPVEQAAGVISQLTDSRAELVSGDDLRTAAFQLYERVQALGSDYNRQVERRNRELRVMGRIGYESTSQRDLDTFMRRAINLICGEMGFYHAQIFLYGRAENALRLTYSRGEAGQEMLARRHALPVGSASIVGAVGAERRVVILNDVSDPRSEFAHRFNPLLPETKAEMALPLIVNDELLGVLDIQSRETDVFLPDDLPTYELLANQIAVAMFNARLRAQSEERIAQIARLNQQLTRSVWTDTAAQIQLEAEFGRPPDRPQLQVPIAVRGEPIAHLEAALPDGQPLTENDRTLLQAVAERVALAIENVRLFEQTQFERSNLTNILATLPAGVLVLDPQTLIPTQVNDRARALLPDVNFSQPFSTAAYHLVQTGTNAPYPDHETPILLTRKTHKPASREDIAYQYGGQHIDLLVNAAPVSDGRGQVIGIVAAFQDISNLRMLESSLQENLLETTVLYETQRVLAEAGSLGALLDAALNQISLRDVEDAQIVFINEMTEKLTLERHLRAAVPDLELLRPVLLPDDSIVLNDVPGADIDPDLRAMLRQMGIGALIVLPLRSRTRELPFGWLLLSQSRPYGFDQDDVRFLMTLADMISTAVERSFLVLSTQMALQETATLYNASTTINRARDIEEVSTALRLALRSMQPDLYAGYLVRADGLVTLFSHQFEQHLGTASLEQLVTLNIDQEDTLLIDDLAGAAPLKIVKELRRMEGIASVGMANLRIQDIVSGRVFVAFRRPRIFSEADARYLSTIGDSTSVVVDNIVLLEQVQATLQETSTLYQASRELTDARTPQAVLEVAVTHLAEQHIGAAFIAMLDRPSWDEANAYAVVMAAWNVDSDADMPAGFRGSDALWQLLAADEIALHTVETVDESQRRAMEQLGCVGLAVLPLRTPERVLGVLVLVSVQAHDYSDGEQRVLQSFAEQASLSLEAARLLAQTERRAAQLQATAQISERIGQILDLDELLPQLVDLIRDRFQFDHVQVFLMDANNEYAVLRASTGEAGRKLLANRHRLARGSASVIGQVTAHNRVLVAADTASADVPHRPNPLLPDTRSEMALPLVVKGQVVGALDVQSNQPNAFSEEDVQTLTTLAAQISVAIDNARLYESAQSRANEMSFLFDVTTAATAAESLDESIGAVLERIEEALNPDAVMFYLVQKAMDAARGEITLLRPMQARGEGITLDAFEPVVVGDDDDLIGVAGRTMQPHIIGSTRRDARYRPMRAASQSAIVVPISSGSDLLGLVALETQQPNAYSSDTQTLLLTLAGSVAAALENALLLTELQQTNERLREVDRLKSQFLANMSHELRTPLNSIIGFSRVMLRGIDGPLTEMQEQDLTTIYNSGNHLLNLINDILDQAKIEANEMQLRLVSFEVRPMVESVKSIAIGLMKDKALQLVVEVAPNLPPAYGDEFRTRQILLNLMSNAIKFTSQGSVTLRVYQTSHRGLPAIRADVIDTGIGIAEQDMPILFEQFRQVDNSLTRTVGGTGLGLPISKALAELQGGELLVTSALGKGSTFSVIIPTEPRPEDSVQVASPGGSQAGLDTAVIQRPNARETQTAPRIDLPPMPIKRDVMLIEDNKEMVDQFRRALQREGFEVVTIDHPSYAEAMVGQLRPTIVLLDVNFAGGAGWQILQNLKSRDDTSEIPILVTTLSSERARALELGADRYVQRPFMPDQLVATVREMEAEFKRQRILVIDDQPDALRLLRQILTENGSYRVYVAQNGQEGISMVARRRPDLVVLDLRMPEMDGFAVLQELRANPETAKIPVLIVTSDVDLNATEQEALASVRIVPKAQLTSEQYNHFLNEIRNELRTL